MVRRIDVRFAVRLVTLTSLLAIPSFGQTLQVIDAEGHKTSISAAQIAGLAHVSVDTNEHDSPAHYDGVPLSAVLSLGGITLGDSLRGPKMAQVLLAEASDGYKVVFALAELDPAFATREILLADKRDGKPLDSKQGPFRIVAPGDKRPARWIREVTKLSLVAVQ
jgi:hypothetical protein